MFSDTSFENDSFLELLISNTSAEAHLNDDEELVNDRTPFIKNILGSEFENYSSDLSLIITPIEIEDFLKDFKNIQHSYCEDVFKQRIEGIIKKYKQGERYITILLNRKASWIKCFTSQCFIAETQFTQYV
ncbi:572_t:CDS:2, partial [Racocetra fulgida]